MGFTFEQFVADVREAATASDPNAAVAALLERSVADPGPIVALTPGDGDGEVMLFEDEALSIWRCRFEPHVIMPPHEHKVVAHIGAYAGGEKSILFRRRDGALEHEATKVVRLGEVLSLEEDCIHAVTADGNRPSLALHVYMGPLMTLRRGLFDWETGAQIDFTLENFDRLKRPASELTAF